VAVAGSEHVRHRSNVDADDDAEAGSVGDDDAGVDDAGDAARAGTEADVGAGAEADADASTGADADADASAGADAETRRGEAQAQVLGWAAIAVAVGPILLAGVRAAWRGWTPTGDNAYSAVRGRDVFSSHVPLLGTWSSASHATGHQVNHPGPLQFDLMAVPVAVLGRGPGAAVGMALVNATAVGLIGWLVLRRLGGAAATVAMALAALLTWSLGSEMLYDPWSQHAPLLMFALFVVAVWCVVAGDPVALPVVAVAGGYALQTHLSYTLLVPGLTGFALAASAVRWVRRRDRRTLRWLAIGVLTGLVVWVQPLIEQFTGDGEGNVAALFNIRNSPAPTPSVGESVRAMGGTIAVPPAWLPPSYGSPSFHLDGSGRPTWLAAAGLVALALGLVALGIRAWHRGSPAVAAGTATALAALAIGFVTVNRAPMRFGIVPTYLRWMWPLGMVVWLAVALALLDEARTSPRRRGRWPATRWAALGLAATAVAAVATLPTVDNGSASPPWTVDAIHQIDDDVAAAVADEPGVLVDLAPHPTVPATAPALFGVLQDAGVPFYVDSAALIRQLGNARAYHRGDATVRLAVRAGRDDHARPGERLIAASDPLSSGEERELRRLADRVREIIDDHGLPLVDEADAVFTALGQPHEVDRIAEAAGDPDETLRTGLVRRLWIDPVLLDLAGGPLLDPTVFPADLLDRWSVLDESNANQSVHVYLSRLP
jgi:hypothetical protein